MNGRLSCARSTLRYVLTTTLHRFCNVGLYHMPALRPRAPSSLWPSSLWRLIHSLFGRYTNAPGRLSPIDGIGVASVQIVRTHQCPPLQRNQSSRRMRSADGHNCSTPPHHATHRTRPRVCVCACVWAIAVVAHSHRMFHFTTRVRMSFRKRGGDSRSLCEIGWMFRWSLSA